jgi:nicotinate dehydrogenase subunit B
MRQIMAEEKKDRKENSITVGLDRREFMKFLGGGIVIAFTADPNAAAWQEPPRKGQAPPKMGGPFGMQGPSDFNAYLKIAEDGKVTVYSGKIEMGQGNTTALAQMAADELGVSLDSVHMIMGDTDLCPWDMGTFGSMSIRVFGPALRSAAAEARTVLLELASEHLKRPKSELTAENGVVFATSDRNSRVTFGQLTKGQKITRKLEGKAITKPVSEFTLMGKSVKRLDVMEKVTGKALYAGDIRLPGLLYGKMLRPPAHGAKLKSVDTSAAESMQGVTVIKEDDLIAVLHADPESAEKALSSVRAEYDIPKANVDNETIFDYLLKVAPKPQERERKGDLEKGEKLSTALFEETYLNGYGAHTPIETQTACAKLDGDKMTVWAATQTPFPNQQQIAQALGFPPDKVRVITPFVGGGFGGKSGVRQGIEAAKLAKITGKPIQVSYTRAEEFFYDAFRPAAIVKIKSGINKEGKICLWNYHVYYAGSRSAEQFYDVPNNLMSIYGNWMGESTQLHPFGVGAWRAPGANINVFARESQIDMMAAKAKVDPLEFRLMNTSDKRMQRVLQVAADHFGYKKALGPSGRGVGMACAIDAGTYLAEIAEVKVDKGNVNVKRIVAVQDMGIAINPEGAKMQMEGCIMMSLGYALSEDIRFEGGRILTNNFSNYRVPRFSWMPEIEAILIKNDELAPQGGGEPAIVAVGGAIANAIFDATGARLHQMPMTPERITAAMKNTRKI